VCIQYLRDKQQEKRDRDKYLALSEMQLFEPKDTILDEISLEQASLEADETTSSGLDDIKNLHYPKNDFHG